MASPKKLLILGASGFIGRNLLSYYASKPEFEVWGTYLKNPLPPNAQIPSRVKLLKADLTDKTEVNDVIKGKDIVIQAAATTSGAKDIVSKPYYHVTDNAVMNSLLFRACHEQQVKHVIFFSCTTMYSEQPRPVKETDFDYRIIDKYFGVGWTKVYIEKLCEFYARIGQTKYTAIRHSNIYGPHDKFDLERSHVFGATVTKVMKAADGKITVWGDGSEERDLLHVDDLISFVNCALQKQMAPFELVNVGLGKSISVHELVRKIIEISGKNLKVEYDKSKPSINFKLSLNIDRAKNIFGWSPKVSLDEGIVKTLAWYEETRIKTTV
ncbi:MAG: NAD-dependent epimerase/dehydratase family protein [Candidatus Omnitrophica bacterium]|nr:NAD-dependent epimerase/dehydratase family protein [Candidatus Omnitrophota bacterium]